MVEMKPCNPYPSRDHSSELGTLGLWTHERAGALSLPMRVWLGGSLGPGTHLPIGSYWGACWILPPPRATENLPVKDTLRGGQPRQ